MNRGQLQRVLQQGLAHHQAGRWEQAENLYRQARSAAPKLFDAFHLSGVLAYQQSRYKEAAEFLNHALRLDPKSAVCEMRLGLAHAALGRHAEAETRYRASLQRDPKTPETWNNLAVSQKALGQLTDAAASYRRAIELRPDYHDAHDRLGALLTDLEGMAAGIPHFRRSVALNPKYASGWCNLGFSLTAIGQFVEALKCFTRALEIEPTLTQAIVGRGLAFQQSYRLREALDEFGSALARQPTHHEARSSRLLTMNYLAGYTREQIFQEHLAFGRAAEGPVAVPRAFSNSKDCSRRLRVAFLSPDLRSHSVAYFLEPLLRHLDRERFEIVLYHDHFKVDAFSEKLRAHASLWRNFVGQFHDVVEATIRSDSPDLLIDLAGHTGFNRLPLFARRLAPLQINYLGYPNTSGLRAMDYRFVDGITDPGKEDELFHTEKLVRFAPTAWAYDPPATAPVPERAPRGESAVTFGSFNNFAKLSDETLRLWSRVLMAVPESLLVLKGHGLETVEVRGVVLERLQTFGLEPARIQLLGRTPNMATHLAAYSQIDIALDPFPYHGTTTTCEALWMGVPLVSLRGDRHAARVSASILTAAKHPEWIAESANDYVRIAAELAQGSARLNELRKSLRDDMRESALLDHSGQAKRFGDALTTCWKNWCEGEGTKDGQIPE